MYQDQVGTLIYAVRSRVLLSVVGCAALLAACLGLPPPPPPPPSPPAAVSTCGTSFCAAGQPWSLYGSTIYNPGLTPYLSGINNPSGTIVLVNQARLNTIRITNFLDREGDPSTAPYDPTRWAKVDAMIVLTRLGVVRRNLLNELKRNLDAAPASKLGYVVTDAKLGEQYGYDYPYYEYSPRTEQASLVTLRP